MEHRNPKDKNAAIDWARAVTSKPDSFIIMDTETTGTGNNDVVIQIGAIDLKGNVLIDTLIKPTKRKRMSSEATAVHGITMKMLKDSPTLEEIVPQLATISDNKVVIFYNAEFDKRLLFQTFTQDNVSTKWNLKGDCAMYPYAAFVGDWNEKYRNYTWKKLPSSEHNCIGDCKATLKLIYKMANTPFLQEPKKWYEFWK